MFQQTRFNIAQQHFSKNTNHAAMTRKGDT